MGFVMSEIVVQQVLQDGIRELRNNRPMFEDLFGQYTCGELTKNYGQAYRDEIWTWFTTTKIPVVQAWSFNVTRVPAYSIRLAVESEDIDKAALGDIAMDDMDGELLTGVLNVNIDIGIHANKSGDHILWLYYICVWCLYRRKLQSERLGLQLSTFSASDYNREPTEMGDNIWTRWVRLKCITQNFLGGQAALEVEDVNLDPATGLPEASSIAYSLDVDPADIDNTANHGLWADSDDEEDDDVLISLPTVGDNEPDYDEED